ncbi:hypothetical protein Vadar_025438 [Vaccinium darrowii]|uniref:Uncharacterized protein n=1 Tax=Vaccinium darrowii TaxID=229202 RepID=A0ACB7ZMI8_9ERIC|nr:hypothetical protein Vadar_025438 [Vaccinium darrowii]
MASPPSRRTSDFSSTVNYPFTSEVNVANFVPLKLDPSNYLEWKPLMLNFIEINRLVGFVDGTIQPPPLPSPKAEEEQSQEQYRSWKRSDGLVRGWILVTVTEEILLKVVGLKTARNVWVALEQMLIFSPPESIDKPAKPLREEANGDDVTGGSGAERRVG